MQIFDGATVDGNSDIIELPRPFGNRGYQPLFTVFAWGTWDGATMTFQISPDGTNWFTIPDLSFTADDMSNIMHRAFFFRGVISGAGATTDLNAVLR